MLTKQQLKDIKKLQEICESQEGINLKLNWDMLENRTENEKNDFLYYEHEQLIGFLGLYGFGNKVEISGMVHPTFRRKGIFSQLFKEAMAEITKHNFTKVLLNTPANSPSGKQFLQTIPCELIFSEYQMKWEQKELFVYDDVQIRQSVSEADFQAEVQLDVQSFGFALEEAISFNKRIKTENTQSFYVIEHDGETVGKIRTQRQDGESWIYGFAIFPEKQGNGIGKKALQRVILQESSLGYDVFLEVETQNAHALRLYETSGFNIIQAQDYYLLTI
ncbi:GNAT family N-acetyltransferase [Caldibacillus lycopersici]|uniref:GNAT family N-acetyltransferase n=1 Tax=Perspicuibacillus lycopersici TaxID=1325689 RepID=A0AAE3LNG1_9BACI|nr:GNAT family N-acetyltransferase [Perspicuibacillus lycopersici]MCU9614665.1 GNAT family N-acetyltransferase [Perspicuibacillus lycopersici]